jgi:triosephosphate isomerase
MARRKIAAGNWKMNTTFESGMELARNISHANIPEGVEVIMGIPYVFLKPAIDMLLHVPKVSVSAQNCHFKESGAFTGEISTAMLSSISCPYVILGHSERRQYFNESSEMLASKVDRAFAQNIDVIFCCGESLEIRKAGTQNEYVCKQIEESLFHLSSDQFKTLVIAYEPIWAIGTGETASPEQAQDMHKAIRGFISQKYGEEVASIIPILYGGSVKSANAQEIFGQEDVDGGLVGGASLDAEHFEKIINSFN